MKYVNENGDRVEIVVNVKGMQYGVGKGITYTVSDVLITPPRKRKAKSYAAEIRDRYEYRSLDYGKRPEYVHQQFVKLCTQERIDQAVQETYAELHEQIKLENATVDYHVY